MVTNGLPKSVNILRRLTPAFVHLHFMDQKFKIQNFFLLAALIFSVLFPSVHALEHIANAEHEHECVHQYGETKTEITHQHKSKDNCVICDFTLISFLNIERNSIQTAVVHLHVPYFFHATDHRDNIALSVIQLRGPPQV